MGTAKITVFPDALGNEDDDLRTLEDNSFAADTVLSEIRKYSELAEGAIIASIAGGRKSMGALMMSCMSLLGCGSDSVSFAAKSHWEGDTRRWEG